MQFVHIPDPIWQMTFPHRVVPLPDEWFPGLLLRCDQANHWESGTTFFYLRRRVGRSSFHTPNNIIVVPSSMFDVLVQALALPMYLLLATTYQSELARLYSVSVPHPRQLSTLFSFSLCSVCLMEMQLLKRTLSLPHITLCPLHHVVLVNTCQCGSLLSLLSPQTLPFICLKCGMNWAALPHELATSDRIALEQKILSYYFFFFGKGTPLHLSQALQRVRQHLKQKKENRVKCLDGSIKIVEHYELTKVSLGYLIDLLVSLDLSPMEEG